METTASTATFTTSVAYAPVVGAGVGEGVGTCVGKGVGASVGIGVGEEVGEAVANGVGSAVGAIVGEDVGDGVGLTVQPSWVAIASAKPAEEVVQAPSVHVQSGSAVHFSSAKPTQVYMSSLPHVP
jgi:hypothetical protein